MIEVVQTQPTSGAVHLATRGMLSEKGYEVSLGVRDVRLLAAAKTLLANLPTLLSGLDQSSVVQYGYWFIQIRELTSRLREIWEHSADTSRFVAGAEQTLTYWVDQHDACARHGASFSPPASTSLIVVSEGVLEGEPVQGVRYPSPGHMSGWWITSDRYNGDVSTLRNQHAYHVTRARSDLTRLLAFPSGYRFDLAKGEDVWFDPSLLEI